MRLPEEPDLPVQINVVPLIDVIFALLTFFIMSTLFLTRQEGLPVNLPKASTAQQQTVAAAKVTITIDTSDQISLNKQPTKIDNLPEQIRNIKGNNQEILVIINADAKVEQGQVVAVMDKVRQVKGTKLAIATTR